MKRYANEFYVLIEDSNIHTEPADEFIKKGGLTDNWGKKWISICAEDSDHAKYIAFTIVKAGIIKPRIDKEPKRYIKSGQDLTEEVKQLLDYNNRAFTVIDREFKKDNTAKWAAVLVLLRLMGDRLETVFEYMTREATIAAEYEASVVAEYEERKRKEEPKYDPDLYETITLTLDDITQAISDIQNNFPGIAIDKLRGMVTRLEGALAFTSTKSKTTDEIVAEALKIPSDSRCLRKALSTGEPFFVLRSQDIFAPALVRDWARSYLYNEIATKSDYQNSLEKYHKAMRIADAMETWPNRKYPD